MEIFAAKDISFTYPDRPEPALKEVNFSIEKGEFVLLCGASGSGKSTLLKLLKHDIAPHGYINGTLIFKGMELKQIAPFVRAKEIGIVFQNPENQIVMEKVIGELLFGLENVGYSTQEMRKKLAEMVHFFGLNHLLERNTNDLSGGEKQLLNLASVLLLDPEVLLLDEPTAQLDPIAAKELIYMLKRINDELGITIVIVEHRLEELFSIANKVIVLENGRLIMQDTPREIVLKLAKHTYLEKLLPSASLVYLHYENQYESANVPLSVKEAKQWLETKEIVETLPINRKAKEKQKLLELSKIDFQYNKQERLVLNNLHLSVYQGEWLAILGANGTGKTTLIKVISGIYRAQHGYLKYKGKKVKKVDSKIISYLPQNPALYFLRDTILEEYQYIAKQCKVKNAENRIQELVVKFQIDHLKHRHPQDLSGGEQQKAAMVGALITNPAILLVDEPTKGIDPHAKEQVADLLRSLKEEGLTIIMVTHDVEFAANYSTRCALLFQGEITVIEDTKKFFRQNAYYTTVMNRITRNTSAPPVVTLGETKFRWNVQKSY
ncbi:ABC transporter ATP-binding protein [Virgibacillus sp. SK37]|uniref:ABC transporter ATP-binding protein n=1 Tax=Virgibacillus sp. SK37 TaxID=403957 RepID=UPI0004D19DA9|nr:energy-coupling factor transporter ATPase [Virgibacillus sp. SK37]AIF44283.1 cobalt ABC transporter ATP-binding protein [Virgibacillus sp. SK37]